MCIAAIACGPKTAFSGFELRLEVLRVVEENTTHRRKVKPLCMLLLLLLMTELAATQGSSRDGVVWKHTRTFQPLACWFCLLLLLIDGTCCVAFQHPPQWVISASNTFARSTGASSSSSSHSHPVRCEVDTHRRHERGSRTCHTDVSDRRRHRVQLLLKGSVARLVLQLSLSRTTRQRGVGSTRRIVGDEGNNPSTRRIARY